MIENGHGPLAGWAIAAVMGRTLIGKLHDEENKLSPVLELDAGLVLQQQGAIKVCFAKPLLGMVIEELYLPHGVHILRVERLKSFDRDALAKAVAQGMDILEKLRAANTGIMLAPSGVKLPPPPSVQ